MGIYSIQDNNRLNAYDESNDYNSFKSHNIEQPIVESLNADEISIYCELADNLLNEEFENYMTINACLAEGYNIDLFKEFRNHRKIIKGEMSVAKGLIKSKEFKQAKSHLENARKEIVSMKQWIAKNESSFSSTLISYILTMLIDFGLMFGVLYGGWCAPFVSSTFNAVTSGVTTMVVTALKPMKEVMAAVPRNKKDTPMSTRTNRFRAEILAALDHYNKALKEAQKECDRLSTKVKKGD